MAHVRTQIRNAFAAAVTGLTLTAARVVTSSTRVFAASEMPALRVTTRSETSDTQSLSAPAVMERTLTIECEARAIALNNVQDTIDEICADVEAAIGADPTLAGTCALCYPTGVEIEIDEQGEQPAAVATMTFTCRYYTTQTAPETAI